MSLFKSAFLYLLQNFIIQSSVCANSSTWKQLNETNVNYNTSVIEENSIPLMMCLLRCQNTLACIAVQVNEVSSKCELLMHSPPDGKPSLTGRSGWTFYEKANERKTCDDGWINFQDSCYYIGKDTESGTFGFCQSLCVFSYDTDLANIEAEEENTFILDAIQHTEVLCFRFGLRYNSMDGVWYDFSSKEPATFMPWADSEPHLGNTDKSAVYRRDVVDVDFVWRDEEDRTSCVAICEKRAN